MCLTEADADAEAGEREREKEPENTAKTKCVYTLDEILVHVLPLVSSSLEFHTVHGGGHFGVQGPYALVVKHFAVRKILTRALDTSSRRWHLSISFAGNDLNQQRSLRACTYVCRQLFNCGG